MVKVKLFINIHIDKIDVTIFRMKTSKASLSDISRSVHQKIKRWLSSALN